MQQLLIAMATGKPTGPAADAGAITWDGIATLIAGALAALVVLIGYFIQQWLARKERRAGVYSEALRAVEDYLEAPYRIRRKDGSDSTRQMLVQHVSDVQSRIAYYSRLLEMHAPTKVNLAYAALVASARAEAGPQMSAGWRAKPMRRDSDVPLMKRFDRSRSDAAMAVVLSCMSGWR